MSTATSTPQPRKRIRFNENNDNITPTIDNKKITYNLYSGVLASLQPAIRHVADVYFQKLTSSFKLFNDNKEKLKKFEDDATFIPRSCKTNFTVGASTLIKGSNDFNTLLDTIDNNNKAIATQQRSYVLQLIKLELEASKTKLRDLFCECLFKLSTIFLHNCFFGQEINNESIHALSITVVSRDPSIIKYIFEDNLTTFKSWYNKKHRINTSAYFQQQAPRQRTPIITARLPNGSLNIHDYNPTEGELASYEYAESQTPGAGIDILLAHRRVNGADLNAEEDDEEIEVINTTTFNLPRVDMEQYATLLFRMVNSQWSHMLQLHHSKLVNAHLTRLAETLVTAEATDDAAIIVAQQPPASEAIISELIEKKFKELENKLVKGKPTTKNNKRGEKQPRASLKTNPKSKNKSPKSNTKAKKQPSKQQATTRGRNNNNVNDKQTAASQTPRRTSNRNRQAKKADEQGQGSAKGKKKSTNNRTQPQTPKSAKKKNSSKSNQTPGTNKSKKTKGKQR
jgi:hypothetical protein